MIPNTEIDVWIKNLEQSLQEDGIEIRVTTVSLSCGICEYDYEVVLATKETRIPECPQCKNTTHQLLIGQ
jgi:Zn finger protein HypA/HybF involved in hydrogenase expression